MSNHQHTEATDGTTDAGLRSPSSGRQRARWGRRLSVTTAVIATVAISGIAVAAWNVTGEGSGSAAAASAEELVIEDFVLAAALYPGLTTNATLTVSNPNLFPVSITAIEFGELVITGAGAGCTVVASQVTFADVTGASLFLAAETDDIELVLTDVATMGTGANDDCQGATFTAPIDLTAESTVAP
jgi:hypothetical protein